ncbi:uncharacterized protein LOC135220259 [Macrobrachium nipponense]|uniref:uncharacterized protein LOC135220259 n=1 Tax=Macrobrachium nipponense TaxID=159736 RepID=UPI0030C8203C
MPSLQVNGKIIRNRLHEAKTLSPSEVNTENVPQTGEQVLNPDVTPGISGVGNTKRKCSKKSKHSEEENALKNSIGTLNQPQDDDSWFGEYVVSELRQLRSIEKTETYDHESNNKNWRKRGP